MCCFCSFTIKFRLSVPFWYILHAYVSLLPVKFFSLSSLWMDLVSIGTFCWFQCVNYVCVLSAKTLLPSYTVSSVWLGSFLLFFFCVCVFPDFSVIYMPQKGRESDSATIFASHHYFFIFWPASISNIAFTWRGKEILIFFLFFSKISTLCVCICFVHLWFVSLFCSRLIHHPMNRNILVFCD